MSARGAAACWLVAGIAYPTLEAAAARVCPDTATRTTSSVISQAGFTLSHLMNTGFVLQGTLFFVGALSLARASETTGPVSS